MYTLDIQQVEFIKSMVEHDNLYYSHLQDDLVDHICCDVELMMEDGVKFQEALGRVKKEIGIGGLKRIQESTLFLIDKNYRSMKKTMRIFGLIAPTLMAISALFKVYHWPGAGPMLTLGAVLLSFVFLPTAVYTLYRETKSKKRLFVYITGFFGAFCYVLGVLFKIMHWPGGAIIITLGLIILPLLFLPSLLIAKLQDETDKKLIPVYVITFVSVIIFIMGMLFKIEHWPGAGIMLGLGMLSIIFIALPVYYFVHLKHQNFVKGSFIFIVVALTELVITGGLMRLSTSGKFYISYQDTEEKLYQTIQFLENKNARFYSNMQDETFSTALKKIQEKSNAIDQQLQDMKLQMIRMADNENVSRVVDGEKLNLMYLQDNLSYAKLEGVLMGNESNGMAYRIYNELKDYYSLLEPESSIRDDLSRLLFFAENIYTIPKQQDWVAGQFSHTSMQAVLNQLTLWQRNIRYIESQVLVASSSNLLSNF